MSFITKRERVFHDYDLFELPPRNECKLKAFGSCTDARAWSHFGSDKTEHLVDVIKRNNGTCRPSYLPTEVIVNTLMGAKNTEIARLKRKIAELEQMIAAFDQLELSCDQKVEIAAAHAAIKAANKELDDMCLDLDLSGFTEGIDSEAFETGKSRGDDPSPYHPQYRDDEVMTIEKSKGSDWSFSNEKEYLPIVKTESKGNQTDSMCPCDKSTNASDPRIYELQDTIIEKDAKLSAMQNTIAVMENDVCEPYCIYAHIYTALEKIFGVLSQNDKYNQYLNLLSAGKDLRCIDIKGKILFKMKVLEKFCIALIAPCSQRMIQSEFNSTTSQMASRMNPDCCYHAEIHSEIETSFALTSEESFRPILDSKRAQLVADIIEHDEMKKILDNDNISEKASNGNEDYESFRDDYSINAENVKRLKDLQISYDDLMKNYENMQHEKDCLLIRCQRYDELETELEILRNQLGEYKLLWNERDYYKRRSENLDALKEQYFVLTEETSGMETRLKAEAEINCVKSNTIDTLRAENIELEKRLNEAVITFEKEKNRLQCNLKEFECKTMCKDQEIKSLSSQVDRLLDQDNPSPSTMDKSVILIAEIESLKEQIENIKSALLCTDEEKQQLQKDYEDSLKVITDLKMETETWKSSYEQSTRKCESHESLTKNYQEKIKSLTNSSLCLEQEVAKKNDEILQLKNENILLQTSMEKYHSNVSLLTKEKEDTLNSLELVRKESGNLVARAKNDVQTKENQLQFTRNHLKKLDENNQKLKNDLAALEKQNENLNRIIETCKESLQSAETERDSLTKQMLVLSNLPEKVKALEQKLENMQREKNDLRNDLADKRNQIKSLTECKSIVEKKMQILEIKSQEQLDQARQSLCLQSKLENMEDAYRTTTIDKEFIENELTKKCNECDELLNALNDLSTEKEQLTENFTVLNSVQKGFELKIKNLQNENEKLLNELDKKQSEYDEIFSNHEQLKKEFNKVLYEQDKLQKQNIVLNEQNRTALSDKNDLEETVNKFQNQLIAQSTAPKISYENISNQIQIMEKEKSANRQKIRDLQDKLEQLENETSIYQDELSERNAKIAILENHINELDDEVKRLQENLQLAVHTGEDIKDTSREKFDQSIKRLEAHHSKATHNMKMDLAKLKTLEQTLLKVQSSSQLLSSKASEAQMIAEKEREKICHEKENAIRDKNQLEQEVVNLKQQLEKQNLKTRDLEAEIQNDKLILGQVKESTQNYIEKLKEEFNKLQKLYDDSLSNIEDLQRYAKTISVEKENLSKMLDNANDSIKQKALEIKILSNDLESFKNKSLKSVTIQVEVAERSNKKSQTTASEMLNHNTPSVNVYGASVFKSHNDKNNENISEGSPDLQLNPDELVSYVDCETQTQSKESFYSFKRNYIVSKMQRLVTKETEYHSVLFNKIESTVVELPLVALKKDVEKVNTTKNKVINLYNKPISLKSSKYDFALESSNNESKELVNHDASVKEISPSSPNILSDDEMIYIYNDSESTSRETTKNNLSQFRFGNGSDTRKIQKYKIIEKQPLLEDNKQKTSNNSFNKESSINKKEISYENFNDIDTEKFDTESFSLGATSDDGKDSINFYTVNPSPKRIYSDFKLQNEIISIDRRSPSLPSMFKKSGYDSNTALDATSDENIKPFYNLKEKNRKNNDRDEIYDFSDESKDKKDFKSNSRTYMSFAHFSNAQTKPNLDTNKKYINDFGLEYILDSVSREIDPNKTKLNPFKINLVEDDYEKIENTEFSRPNPVKILPLEYETKLITHKPGKEPNYQENNDKPDNIKDYEHEIESLTKTLHDLKEKCKHKIEVIKIQYDNNIKQFIIEHNQGVKNMQSLHEQTLQDKLKAHENEVENLRAMTLEAMRKAEKLEKENKYLKSKLPQYENRSYLDEKPVSLVLESSRRKHKSHGDTRLLTKTNIEAFNVKPKARGNGPCTCSVDVHVSDTIKNIFEQVDVEQRKIAEQAYLKYIAQKIVQSNIENLEAEELSFLHLKVCRNWKTKVTKEEAFQKKIDSLESELLNKQRNAQQHMAELDRRVADERRKLQEVREAVCLTPGGLISGPGTRHHEIDIHKLSTAATVEGDVDCSCDSQNFLVHRSGGNLVKSALSQTCVKPRTRSGNRALLIKQDSDGRREKKLYSDEPPTRLRRSQDRHQALRPQKK